MNAIAFYTTPLFWAGEPLDLAKLDTLENLPDLMSEVVFSYDCESFILNVCKDGMLALHMRNLEAEQQAFKTISVASDMMKCLVGWWGRYLDYANCLNLLLDSSIIEVEKNAFMELSEITNKDAMRMKPDGMQPSSAHSLFFFLYLLRFPKAYGFEEPKGIPSFPNRFPVRKDVFDLTAKRFSEVGGDEKLVRGLSSVAKSVAEYKVENYRMSIVVSWFVIELNLLRKWKDFLEKRNKTNNDGSKRIHNDRKKRLKSRDYQISVIIKKLELSGVLDCRLFCDIKTIRDYRNRIVHQDPDYDCEPRHCQLAIETALKLTLEGRDFKITPNLVLSIIGT